MSAIFHLSFRRRLGRQWAERTNSLRQIGARMAAATERALQRLFGNQGALVPIPVKTAAKSRRSGQGRVT